MTRESRLLLVIAVLAVLGVTSLFLIANRYRRLVEQSPGLARAASDSDSEAGDDDLRRAAANDLVARFVAIRAAVVAMVGENRAEFVAAVDPQTLRLGSGSTPEESKRLDRAVDTVRSRRATAIDRHGLAEADYDRLRRAYLEWLSGQPVDPLLEVAFDGRRAQLEHLALGPLESLDEAAPDR